MQSDESLSTSSNKLCEICSKDEKMFLLTCLCCNLSVHSHCYLLETFQDPWVCQACLHRQVETTEASCRICSQSKGALRLYPKGWYHVICRSWPSHRFLSEGTCGLCSGSSGKFVNCEVCWDAFHPFCGYLKGLRYVAGKVSCDEHFGFETGKEDFSLEMNKNEKSLEDAGEEPKKKRKIEDFFDLNFLKKQKNKEFLEDLEPENQENPSGDGKTRTKDPATAEDFKENLKKSNPDDLKDPKGKVFKGFMELRSRGKGSFEKKQKFELGFSQVEEKAKELKNHSEKTKSGQVGNKADKKVKNNQKFSLNQNIAKSLKIKSKGTFEEIHQRVEDYLFLNGEVTNKGYSLSKNLQKIFGVKVILYKDVKEVLNKFCSLTS